MFGSTHTCLITNRPTGRNTSKHSSQISIGMRSTNERIERRRIRSPPRLLGARRQSEATTALWLGVSHSGESTGNTASSSFEQSKAVTPTPCHALQNTQAGLVPCPLFL